VEKFDFDLIFIREFLIIYSMAFDNDKIARWLALHVDYNYKSVFFLTPISAKPADKRHSLKTAGTIFKSYNKGER
jgi:hypothetical protein